MSYQILNSQTVIEYVRYYLAANPEAAFGVLDVTQPLESAELSDGNLNFVYRVLERDQPHNSILLKQSVPYLRVAGEAWQLTTERAAFEAHALALEHRLAVGFVPQPYWFDKTMCVNAMQDLRDHSVMRRPMLARVRFENLGERIGLFLAKTLYGTSDFALEPKIKKSMVATSVNAELCQITEDLIFTEPFEAVLLNGQPNRNQFDSNIQPELEQMQANVALKAKVATLKYIFMTSAQALLHGDLHTGSIMASQPDQHGIADIRVIDPEFAFFGPIGFDVGVFLANLYLNAIAQHGHAPDVTSKLEYQQYLLHQARTCWTVFATEFGRQMQQSGSVSWRSSQFQAHFLESVLQAACGFAGCEVIRRSVGFAHVLDVDSIANAAARASVLRQNLQLGTQLILRHQDCSSFDDVEQMVERSLQSV